MRGLGSIPTPGHIFSLDFLLSRSKDENANVDREGGRCCPGGLLFRGMVLSITGRDITTPSSPHGQTDRCKNITLPQTSFAAGNNDSLLGTCYNRI